MFEAFNDWMRGSDRSKVAGKPNLRLRNGWWRCGTSVFDTYQASTPALAFDGWLRVTH